MFLLFLFHENIISGLFLDVFHILHYTDFGKIILMKRKFKRNLWIFVHRNWDSLKFRFISIFNKIPNIYLMSFSFRDWNDSSSSILDWMSKSCYKHIHFVGGRKMQFLWYGFVSRESNSFCQKLVAHFQKRWTTNHSNCNITTLYVESDT